MLITIDTNILIWGVRAFASDGQEGMIGRATQLLEWAEEKQHQIILTSTVVSEYLICDSDDQRMKEFAAIARRFKVVPFDTKAARIAATLRSDRVFVNNLQKTRGHSRVAIKADIAIVATAKAHKIERIYSNDNRLRNCADRIGLDALDVPELKLVPGTLFNDDHYRDAPRSAVVQIVPPEPRSTLHQVWGQKPICHPLSTRNILTPPEASLLRYTH